MDYCPLQAHSTYRVLHVNPVAKTVAYSASPKSLRKPGT